MTGRRARAAGPFVSRKVDSPIGGLGQIARELGNPRATRAVGAANGRNPIAIIAPCHRLIGASGALTGFAGGLKAKSSLLALEKAGRQSPDRVGAGVPVASGADPARPHLPSR